MLLRQPAQYIVVTFLAASVVGAVLLITVSLVLWIRFCLTHDESVGRAGVLAVFHTASAFNNAGFALFKSSRRGQPRAGPTPPRRH